ncbi:Tex-like N-terminal domain-containing protein [uncultured Phascolarctobacterium sp.]|uniref:Tex family protein n=1 Tax=uncultured Phascolarctobacterium sp. TaxID=512296 RepID=UPI0027D9AE3C|nr:Tex-like N-terminal domain-containing protein [uncultured Phascolarctobacterium sp.]
MSIEQIIAGELSVRTQQVTATLELLDGGNTIPFVARYRKEVTGSLDEEQIRTISERSQYLRNLEARRQEILEAITAQEKLTPELEAQIMAAVKMQELEDLYLPYRPKKRTRAQIARERGLEPLAELLLAQAQPPMPFLEKLAILHIDPDKGVHTVEEAWAGASDIVAEDISDRADIRELIRKELWKGAELASTLTVDEKEGQDYLMYKEYAEPVRQLPPHRILALNRGESKNCLKLTLNYPSEAMLAKLAQKLKIQPHTVWTELYTNALADSYKRLLFPSLERELRNELTEKAEKQAISVFAANLRQLLLQQPVAGHTVLGLDPGYRTGCKAAVIDPQGRTLAINTLYITGSQHQHDMAEAGFMELVTKYKVTLVAIGNGTASFETEEFTAQMIEKHRLDIAYLIVSEAGASVYSASKLAREELPDLDVSLRGAVSIARRVQDPLAELVKIEPKAIGVGQYQHDVNQKELTTTLGTVVESCVNHVGVELNTASPALLSYVAGVSGTVAKNIIAYRDDNGAFNSRKELLKVARLGPAAFTQCAGFLRIAHAKNPLDNTSVHPESYALAEHILGELGFDLKHCTDLAVQEAAAKADAAALAAKLEAGLPTVTDILEALARPGRDPREDAPAPLTRKKVAKLSELEIGSVVKGTVQNVVDFGVFVDIGLKTSGLIHRSELSNSRFRHPLDVVSVGDIIEPIIISIDEQRNRIGLSLKRAPKQNS